MSEISPSVEDEATELSRLVEQLHGSLRTDLKALTSDFETVWLPPIHGLLQYGDEPWSGLPWNPGGLLHRMERLSPSVIDDPLQSILKFAEK